MPATPKSISNLMKKIDISTPAYIALVAYVILGIVLLLPVEYTYLNKENGKYERQEYNFGQRLLMIIMMTIPVALSVYSINCMMVGKCTALSYVMSLITVFWIAIFVITVFLHVFSKSR
jgi:predicted transporter